VGVSPELLRAWETRYGLLRPERTAGGLRLFSEGDERRVRRMCEHIATGMPASEAARLAKLEEEGAEAGEEGTEAIEELLEAAVESMDEAGAQAALDTMFRRLPLQRALVEVILPFLNTVGERWASSQMNVAQEHFASNLIGGRLRGLSRGWGEGVGPLAVLACPSGEHHDLGLLCFGLALRERGWRITYFGADTPLAEITASLEKLSPTVVVLCATTPQPLLDGREEVGVLSGRTRVAVGGGGVTEALAEELGLEYLGGDPVSEASALRP
jgi:MerR family transcriptional regulator, light-induced transcriptional regulator